MRVRVLVLLGLLALVGTPAFATPIDYGQWYEFQFGAPTGPAMACTSCVAGVDSEFALAPPWTFWGAGQLTVTDAFLDVDRFLVRDTFDFVLPVQLGYTSPPSGNPARDCGNDPVACMASGWSSGVYDLWWGHHAITIDHVAGQSGAAFFRVDPYGVPEPASLLLFGIGMTGLGLRLRRRRQ